MLTPGAPSATISIGAPSPRAIRSRRVCQSSKDSRATSRPADGSDRIARRARFEQLLPRNNWAASIPRSRASQATACGNSLWNPARKLGPWQISRTRQRPANRNRSREIVDQLCRCRVGSNASTRRGSPVSAASSPVQSRARACCIRRTPAVSPPRPPVAAFVCRRSSRLTIAFAAEPYSRLRALRRRSGGPLAFVQAAA